MPRTPSIAVVLEGGLVTAVIVEDWPAASVLPHVCVVDHDTEGADRDALTQVVIGGETVEAYCRGETVRVYQGQMDVLSPRTVLATIDEPFDHADGQSPVELARSSLVECAAAPISAEPIAADKA